MTEIEHLLVCLAEEAAEVQQRACKALRFGLADWHGDMTNAVSLELELTDLIAVMEMLVSREVFDDPRQSLNLIRLKKHKVLNHMEGHVE